MRHVISLLILALGVSVTAGANDCSVFEKIGKAGLNENAAFWGDYARLAEKGEPSAKDVEALMAKYNSGEVPPASASKVSSASQTTQKAALQTSPKNPAVELRKAAEKGYSRAPAQVQSKMDEFLSLYKQKGSSFVHDLKENGGWNFEPMREQKGLFSVRLNGGYRATFTMDDGELKILDIGQHIYRH